jgi:hypothetical protein
VSIDLSAPEVKEAIKAAVEEATAPLIAKRDELLSEVKKARKGQQIDPETVTALETQIETLKGELSTAQKAVKTANADAEKARKALEVSDGFTSKLLVDNGLTEALTKAGVTNPVHLKAAKSMLAGQVQIVADGESKVAKVGEKALAEFAAEWAKGDEGKHFVAAPANGGGGSQGGGGAGGSEKLPEPKSSGAGISAAEKAARVKAIEARLMKAGAE